MVSFLLPPVGMIKFACWNIRGMNSRIKQKEIKYSIKKLGISLYAVIEAQIRGEALPNACSNTFGLWSWVSNVLLCDRGTRIVISWDSTIMDVMVMEGHDQYVHCVVRLRSVNEPFYVTVAYGSNNVIARRELWSGLLK